MLRLVAYLALASSACASVQQGKPDAAPAGYEEFTSPIVVPSPNTTGRGNWADAVNKARAFVNQLTVTELANLTTGADTLGRCVGNTGSVPRLNFTGFCLEDSPVGVRFTSGNSVFPAGVNVASTFDAALMHKRGSAMGQEFRDKGVNVALGPGMNLARAGLAGRNWEFAGGDPFLAGVAAAENVKGLQSKGVIGSAKHYIGNEQEHFRGGSGGQAYSSDIDDRTLHELYLWPFAEAVRAGVGSVMCSYNKVNQTSACENSYILNELLKKELGFQGFVVSDWGGTESGVSSILAGLDVNMPGFIAYGDENIANPATANNSYFGAALIRAVSNHSVPLVRLQDMATRLMAAYYQLNQDQGYPALNFNQQDNLLTSTPVYGDPLNENVNVQGNHAALIREIGAASTVLLKNIRSALPLGPGKPKLRYGIFGSDAAAAAAGPNGCSDRGCDDGTLAVGWGSGTANFPYLIAPLDAITSHLQAKHASPVIKSMLNDFDLAAASTLAKNSDICLVFANADSGEGYITVEGNAGDRNNHSLWHGGDNLINTVAASCAKTVVVLHSVGVVDLEAWIDNPHIVGVLWAGLPGQESGNSLVDVMFGAVNPSGRLPYTIAKNTADYPAAVVYSATMEVPQIVYSEKLMIDHRWFDTKDITPRYEFGYGLSYTTFAYSKLKVAITAQPSKQHDYTAIGGDSALYDDIISVNFAVKNAGKSAGNEVSQVYLGFPASSGEPPKILRGFARTFITKGKTSNVNVKLNVKAISVWDVVSQQWTIPDGKYTVYVGSSSRKIKLTGYFVAAAGYIV